MFKCLSLKTIPRWISGTIKCWPTYVHFRMISLSRVLLTGARGFSRGSRLSTSSSSLLWPRLSLVTPGPMARPRIQFLAPPPCVTARLFSSEGDRGDSEPFSVSALQDPLTWCTWWWCPLLCHTLFQSPVSGEAPIVPSTVTIPEEWPIVPIVAVNRW